MDAMTFATMHLAEHRFAELERENRRRVQHAERRAFVAATSAQRAGSASAARQSEPVCDPAHLALAGPAS